MVFRRPAKCKSKSRFCSTIRHSDAPGLDGDARVRRELDVWLTAPAGAGPKRDARRRLGPDPPGSAATLRISNRASSRGANIRCTDHTIMTRRNAALTLAWSWPLRAIGGLSGPHLPRLFLAASVTGAVSVGWCWLVVLPSGGTTCPCSTHPDPYSPPSSKTLRRRGPGGHGGITGQAQQSSKMRNRLGRNRCECHLPGRRPERKQACPTTQ